MKCKTTIAIGALEILFKSMFLRNSGARRIEFFLLLMIVVMIIFYSIKSRPPTNKYRLRMLLPEDTRLHRFEPREIAKQGLRKGLLKVPGGNVVMYTYTEEVSG